MATPSKFTVEARAGIIAALRCGATFESAGAAVGISRMTLFRWLRKGEADLADGKRSKFAKFAHDVWMAENAVVCEVEKSLAGVAKSGKEWRASAWWLARKRPMSYGGVRGAIQQEVIETTLQALRNSNRRDLYDQVFAVLHDTFLPSADDLPEASVEPRDPALRA